MEGRLPKIQTFSGSDAERYKEGHSTWPVGGIFKKAHVRLYCCVWAIIPAKKMTPHVNTRVAPTKKQKEVPFLVILALFLTKWLGHRGYQDETSFYQLILQSRRRTKNVLVDF